MAQFAPELPDYSHSGLSVSRVLAQLIEINGRPEQVRYDNEPEFLSIALTEFCTTKNIVLIYIQPGKPIQYAYIERFDRTFREDILVAYLFENMRQLKDLSQNWLEDYNLNHPHKSLKRLSPLKYIEEFLHI